MTLPPMARCGCRAAETLSVGWEPQAMCSDMSEGKTKPDRQLALPADAVGEDDDAAPLALQRRLRGTGPRHAKQYRGDQCDRFGSHCCLRPCSFREPAHSFPR